MAKEISKNVEVFIEKVSIKDSKAVVTYYYFQEKNKSVHKEILNLIKKKGKWLADEDE